MKGNNTIEEIDQSFWGNASADVSTLIKTCYKLRKKNLEDFEIEDYRILISQNIALEILIPRAIIILQENIFAEGDFYEGDLLKSVLCCDKDFWKQHVNYKKEIVDLLEATTNQLRLLDTTKQIKEGLLVAIETFKTL